MLNVIVKVDDLYRVVWMSRPLMQAAEASVEQSLARTGLTVRMRAVLEILYQQGDMTVPDIARALEIQRQYVQVMVNETLAANLTTQRANPRHKRSPLLSLTDTGRDLIEAAVARERALLDQIGQGIDAEDAQAALRVVLALTEQLKQAGRGAS